MSGDGAVLLVFRSGFAALAEGFREIGVPLAEAAAPEPRLAAGVRLAVADVHALADAPLHAWQLHRALARRGVPLIALDRDAPWHKGLRGLRGWLVTRGQPYDGYATHSMQGCRMFGGPARYLPNAAWISRYNMAGRTLEEMREPGFFTADVSFVGNLDAQRYPEHRFRVLALRRIQAQLEARGLVCRFLDSRGMSVADQVELIQRSRVNLQLGAAADDRGEPSWGLPERCYGVPACGGFLLSDRRVQARVDFEPGTEWVEFDTLDQCVELAERYARDLPAARRIAEAAHRKVMARHTYAHRARELLDFGEALRAGTGARTGVRPDGRILVIRRDNIGDVICTTPLVASLRQRFPRARIDLLVSDYTCEAVERNPDIDSAFAYTKLKHGREGTLAAARDSLLRLLSLRSARYDLAILAGGGPQPRALKMARLVGARRVVGYADGRPPRGLTHPLAPPGVPLHEVEVTHRLLLALGIDAQPGPLKLVAPPPDGQPEHLRRFRAARGGPLRVGVQISARRLRQRWPIDRYAALIRALVSSAAEVAVFWAPGSADNPTHPGDDALAGELAARVSGKSVHMLPTQHLSELIFAMEGCDMVVTPDGGAMHVAAALGKPIVALFGDSAVEHWRPWGVEHEVVQPASRDLRDLEVGPVIAAFHALLQRTGRASSREVSGA